MKKLDVIDYQVILEHGDIASLTKHIDKNVQEMYLRSTVESLGLFDFQTNVELNHYIREHNNNIFSLLINYSMMKKYLLQGIPDEPFYGPGDNGVGISYFPNFNEEHYLYHFWYGFYVESYYFRFQNMIDSKFHVINCKYDLNIQNGLGFQKNILKKLKEVNPELHYFFHSMWTTNPIYKKATTIRNEITHNFSPNKPSSGLTKHRDNNGKVSLISYGVPDYMPVREIQENIDNTLVLLSEMSIEMQKIL